MKGTPGLLEGLGLGFRVCGLNLGLRKVEGLGFKVAPATMIHSGASNGK